LILRALLIGLLPLSAMAQTEPAAPAPEPAADPFAAWKTTFTPRAFAAGIRPDTLARAYARLEWLPDIIDRDRNQNEFTKTVWEYLDTAVSDDRIARGQQALATHAALFDVIESRWGVDRHIVTAIWGLETSYGAVRGDTPTLSALATLAVDGRRADLFAAQFLAALTILNRGEATADQMIGSWAGAMGHTQFMPDSYLANAVDLTGDGRRDIWGDDPADALASTAAYLANFGWNAAQPWGVEVQVPPGFDYALARDGFRLTPGAWATLGVTAPDGTPVPNHGPAQLLLPGGAQGAAFLIFRNFQVIERYNPADAYVIAVGHLADRLRGGPPIAGDWPRGDRALTFDERIMLQERLTAAGFDPGGIDGLIGPRTIAALRAWQQANGLTPDGYAPPQMLDLLPAE
jgi:membrane-bound lytic murein transglycosylase B